MKDTKQIIEDCGIANTRAGSFLALIVSRKFTPFHADGAIEETMGQIIGALYRRIETLEEEKECLLAEVKALEAAVAGNAARIAKLEAENASFIKDLKLQSIRIAELEIWSDENQGL